MSLPWNMFVVAPKRFVVQSLAHIYAYICVYIYINFSTTQLTICTYSLQQLATEL